MLLALFTAVLAVGCGTLYYRAAPDGPQATLVITNNSSLPAGGGVFVEDPDCVRGMKPISYSEVPVRGSTEMQIDAGRTFTFVIQRVEGVVDLGGARTNLKICNAPTSFVPTKGKRYEAVFQDTSTGGCRVTVYELSEAGRRATEFVSKVWGQTTGKPGFCATKSGA